MLAELELPVRVVALRPDQLLLKLMFGLARYLGQATANHAVNLTVVVAYEL
jgi:hypothetical protein